MPSRSSKLLLLLTFAGCTDPAADQPPGPGPFDVPPDAAPPGSPDGDPGPAPGCSWKATPISSVLWNKTSNLALAVAGSGERAVIFTAASAGHRDLYTARASAGGYVVAPYGLDLLTFQSYDSVAGAFAPDNTLRLAYSNEDGGNPTIGGVYYATGPGTSVLVDGGGLGGRANRPTIAISALGTPRIAYQVSSALDRRIVVATRFATGFDIVPALIDSLLTGQVDLALDAAGSARMAAIEESGRVVFVSETATGWSPASTVTADGGFAEGSSLVATSGATHMTRLAAGRILHVAGMPDAWQLSSVTEASLAIPSQRQALAARIDGARVIHVAWADATGALWYLTTGMIEPVLVARTGQRVSELAIAFGPGGAHLAYAAGSATAGAPVQIAVARCE